jgi:uncharacterized protein involved in tolerance to divalent cations
MVRFYTMAMAAKTVFCFALMIIKTSESSFDQLKDLVEKNHSYDVPEIISLEISQLSPAYAAYLGDFLK